MLQKQWNLSHILLPSINDSLRLLRRTGCRRDSYKRTVLGCGMGARAHLNIDALHNDLAHLANHLRADRSTASRILRLPQATISNS